MVAVQCQDYIRNVVERVEAVPCQALIKGHKSAQLISIHEPRRVGTDPVGELLFLLEAPLEDCVE
jgi:hypothetical protein